TGLLEGRKVERAMPTAIQKIWRPPWVLRVVRARPRLFGAGAFGLAVTLVLIALSAWRHTTCVLVGWDVWVGLYLALAFLMMARSDVHEIQRRAPEQDEGQFMILTLTATAAMASLAAIVAELGGAAGGGNRRAQLILATITIVLSWALIHTIFAL